MERVPVRCFTTFLDIVTGAGSIRRNVNTKIKGVDKIQFLTTSKMSDFTKALDKITVPDA